MWVTGLQVYRVESPSSKEEKPLKEALEINFVSQLRPMYEFTVREV